MKKFLKIWIIIELLGVAFLAIQSKILNSTKSVGTDAQKLPKYIVPPTVLGIIVSVIGGMISGFDNQRTIFNLFGLTTKKEVLGTVPPVTSNK